MVGMCRLAERGTSNAAQLPDTSQDGQGNYQKLAEMWEEKIINTGAKTYD
jgi:hypothetical protein